jgi:hypothetical protein
VGVCIKQLILSFPQSLDKLSLLKLQSPITYPKHAKRMAK